MAISSAEQFIEIYDIEEEKPLAQSVCNVEYQTQVNSGIGVLTANGGNERQTNRYSLPTVGDVVNLIYCSIGTIYMYKYNIFSMINKFYLLLLKFLRAKYFIY